MGSDDDCEIETYFEEWKEGIWKEIPPIFEAISTEQNSQVALSPLEPKSVVKVSSGPSILDPLVDKFSPELNPKLDINVKRILFECKTMKLVKVEKLKQDKSNKII